MTSKEALEKYKYEIDDADDFLLIEKDLKRLEELEKALEIFKELFDFRIVIPYPKGGYEIQVLNKNTLNVYTYSSIDKDEYDLLKNVLL